jgi:Caspase domain
MPSRALLFCNNYVGTRDELRGCYNDGECLKAALVAAGAVAEDRVKTVREATARQIAESLEALAAQSRDEKLEYALVAYSGHGTQVGDGDGDEADGKDEAICPADFETSGVFTDDLLKKLFATFYYKTNVVFMCDACHSGSMLDLRFTYSGRKYVDAGPQADIGHRILAVSGCRDTQTSADAFLGGSKYGGALTDCLLKALKEVPACKADVFRLMQETLRLLKEGGYDQVPVLSSSYLIPRYLSIMPRQR